MKFAIYLFAAAFAAQSAFASCPSAPLEKDWNTHDGDQRVNAEFLQKILAGRMVKFSDGTEHYFRNGTYMYQVKGGGQLEAPNYKYYEDGSRCINFANPRFDLYVVNDRRLIMVTPDGTRLEGMVTK